MRRHESTSALTDAPPAQTEITPLGELADDILSAFAAGAGVAVAALVLAALFGASWLYGPALAAGVLWMAAQLFGQRARNPLDVEWRVWQANQSIRQTARLESQIALISEQRDSALHELAAAREAAAHWQRQALQRQGAYVAPEPPPESQEQRDAYHLAVRRYKHGEPVTKEYMFRTYGWSVERYLAATAVLRQKGFFAANNQWIPMTQAEARTRISPAPRGVPVESTRP
jgi:hypothetical protein